MRWHVGQVKKTFRPQGRAAHSVGAPAYGALLNKSCSSAAAVSRAPAKASAPALPDAAAIYAARRAARPDVSKAALAKRLDPVAIYARRKAAMTRFRIDYSD